MFLSLPPIIAILRGIRPEEVSAVAASLEAAGVRAIEIPLNSPDAIDSTTRLCSEFGKRCLCGAGTVLDVSAVDAAYQAGARLIVTPNTDERVIHRATELGLTVMPGFATATEAFRAINAGANALKLFPAITYGTQHVRALREVLPRDIPLFAVGGVNATNLSSWFDAGAQGVAIGGDLYRPGDAPETVFKRAQMLVATYQNAVQRK